MNILSSYETTKIILGKTRYATNTLTQMLT